MTKLDLVICIAVATAAQAATAPTLSFTNDDGTSPCTFTKKTAGMNVDCDITIGSSTTGVGALLSTLQTSVDNLNKDLTQTPLSNLAFTCAQGTVDKAARKCNCVANKYGGGTYFSGEATYRACTDCDNISCAADKYQSGACSTDDGNNFKCKTCSNKVCEADKTYQTGACGGSGNNKRNNNFQCTDCDNKSCASGKYQTGACGGSGSNKRKNDFQCKDCSNKQCTAANTYRKGTCSGRTNGFTCETCDNISCLSGKYRSGSCSGTSNNYKCNTCSNKSCPSGEYRSGSCSGTSNNYKCNTCSNKSCAAGKLRTGSCSGTNNGYSCTAYKNTCEWRSTAVNDAGGGNSVYFDRHHSQCDGPQEYMQGWRLQRSGSHNIYFQARCCGGASTGTCRTVYTPSNDDGNGNHVYFDRHNLRCGNNEYMKSWRLQRTNSDNIRFAGTCCKTNLGAKSCQTQTTNYNDDGNGNTVYFDRHFAKCTDAWPRMKSWKLQRNSRGNKIRFSYECCKA
jgi:hypothetical protein